MSKEKNKEEDEPLAVDRRTTIYVMALANDKYYIGRSDAPDERIIAHFTTCGSTWTKLHKPERIVSKLEGDVFDEDKMTKKYMHKYGIENVRGASYCQTNLTEEQLASIRRELANVDDRCFECGEKGHFSTKCKAVAATTDDSDVTSLITIMKRVNISPPSKKTPYRCYGCGQEGHFVSDCPQKRRNPVCTRCGRDSHKTVNCYAKTRINGESLK